MSRLQVEPVVSPSALDEFLELPCRLYAAYPAYEAPLHFDRSMLLHPQKSAFWKRAEACYWLARRDGQAVGRISAQVDPILPVGIAPGTGMFGCLDAEDDAETIAALIGAASRWLIERGCSAVFGPCTLDMNDEPGLLVAGADEPAMTLCPWHPPYLGDHLTRLGFTTLRDLQNWRLDLGEVAIERSPAWQIAGRIPGLKVRSPTRRGYAADIKVLCDVYNDGWRDHWGFIPLTPEDLEGLDQLMKWLVPKQAFRIVELQGQPVAVMLLIPNLFEVTRGVPNRPGLRDAAKLAWRAVTHRFKSGRVIVVGLAKHLQGTMTGGAVAALLVDELISSQSSLHGEWVEAGWVLETNAALINILEQFGFRCNKTFRMFGKELIRA